MKTLLAVLVPCGIAIAGEKKPVRVFLTDHESADKARPWSNGSYSGAHPNRAN